MKTIEQLEKEVEEFESGDIDLLKMETKTKLQTLKDVLKLIDEIPDIRDDVGMGSNKEDRVMFRSGYENGRNVFKSELKQTLLTGRTEDA